MRVAVIGTGYVGLVTGACLAKIGHQVVCVDNNAEKVALMQSGRSPIFEPGLEDIMQTGNLEFTTDLGAGVAHGEILFIAVGTPALPTGESDTRFVEIEKLQQILKILKGKTIGLLGLTFKPDTDDLRDAPALDLIEELTRLGAKVKAYDPIIPIDYIHPALSNVTLTTSPESLAEGCDALVLVTDWKLFCTLDYTLLGKQMHLPVMVDGRNFLEPEALEQAGFYYVGMGRPTAASTLLSRHQMLTTKTGLTSALQPVLV